MSKKNKKGRRKGGGDVVVQAVPTAVSKEPRIVKQWNQYFREGELEDWQRLMQDLGFDEEFKSKTQCRKALKKVWVNIRDFLDAVSRGDVPYEDRFPNEKALSTYTKQTGKIYPRRLVEKGSPLTRLLAHIHNPADRYKKKTDIVGLLENTHIY